ncbi:hypothetical protein V8G57_02975 [Collimonas sp. H4R21]|jgi:hypothetical protein|uniref:Uncharacterized protein n=1 Tax=Collimonas rhizosphaerae TaxID=3126357 RepID=A0ABU9PQS7_9BURK|nr:hypothetical protein [Collimonas sp. OK412]
MAELPNRQQNNTIQVKNEEKSLPQVNRPWHLRAMTSGQSSLQDFIVISPFFTQPANKQAHAPQRP